MSETFALFLIALFLIMNFAYLIQIMYLAKQSQYVTTSVHVLDNSRVQLDKNSALIALETTMLVVGPRTPHDQAAILSVVFYFIVSLDSDPFYHSIKQENGRSDHSDYYLYTVTAVAR